MTPLEISSFRAIYFSDCVFNLTMPKWLDITNFISLNKNKNMQKEKLNKGTTFLTIIVNRTKRNAFFTKIHFLDISLGLKLPELKVHTHAASKNIILRNSRTFHFFRRVWVQTISTNYDHFGWESFDNLCTCSNNLHYFKVFIVVKLLNFHQKPHEFRKFWMATI